MKYMIITETSYLKLETSVNHFLEKGWKLAGGVTTWANGFMQAIYYEG